jgi:signal transduction histidine kinase
MARSLIPRAIPKSAPRGSLQTVLIAAFVLQILGPVGLVGYLSFRNGQKAVAELARQLVDEVNDRVDQHLDNYLTTPQQINQFNLFAVNEGLIGLDDPQRLGQYFWKQMQVFPNISYVNFANADGEFVGVGREDDGALFIEIIDASHPDRYYRYRLDDRGNRRQFLWSELYNPRADQWYRDAVTAQKPVWSAVYQWDDQPEIFSISSSYPVYNQQRGLIGVIGVDHILSQTNDFLRDLQVSPSGKVFILERDGAVIASSSDEQAYVVTDETFQRLNAVNSQDPTIRATTRHLIDRFDNLSQITRRQRLQFNLNGDRQFVQVSPWSDKYGLDWLVVVTVPASDFMGQINVNTQTTIALCILALILAITIALFTARWVTQPILRLNAAARAIAQGNWDQPVSIQRNDELGELADTFNQMDRQLKDAFATLEQKVEQRTQALSHTLEQLKTTQAQIVAQEKLASLGSLTAGIAHEIKNPLNFINNFAELSVELSEELSEELQDHINQLDTDSRSYIEELLVDLTQNAQKIHEHGKRADKIVRSMLMHSRGERVDRQLTDINTLLTEAINLSYHGMRAQNSAFNITIETNFDEQLAPIDVVVSDISRVFLNLINNACYATHMKTKHCPSDYTPTLTVSTQDLATQIAIHIRDNGSGIPTEIRAKIFEPFFTTKPAGEGTGLGLSMSYEIITQEHQGSIQVKSEVGQYTEFVITLPKAIAAATGGS